MKAYWDSVIKECFAILDSTPKLTPERRAAERSRIVLEVRMLAHTIDHCTASAGTRRRRRESSAVTIALWAIIAAAAVAIVIY